MKRSFLLFLLALGLFSCTPDTPRSPNIVFIFADDLRQDALGAYGNEVIRTNQIDRLATGGVRFDNVYCMGSHHGAVCAPSRSMLLSGKPLFDVYANIDTVKILPEILREAGYTTFMSGKWHTDNYDSAHIDFKGFDIASDIFFGGMSDHFQVPVRDQVAPGMFSPATKKSFSTRVFTDALLSFFDEQKESQNPFFAYLSLTVPHDPRTPPDADGIAYDMTEVNLPANYLPVHPFDIGWMGRDEFLAGWPRTQEVIRSQIAEYYGLITHMDLQVGRVLDALKEKGLYENTIVIFASDHGLAMGSHGLLGKQNLYEHSMKAPLIIAGPGIPQGRQVKDLYYLHDLFLTIQVLAGVTYPLKRKSLDMSRSWQEAGAGRDYLYLAYEDIIRAVRTENWKMVRYPKLHHDQLFNLADDPYEMHNLSDHTDFQENRIEMTDLMNKIHSEYSDPHSLTAAKRLPMAFDPSGIDRKPDRHQPAWVVEKYFSKNK